MFWNLLTSTATDASSSSAAASGCTVVTFLPWLLIIGAVVLLWFFSRRSQQKQQEQINKTLDAIQPGNKVKTIGGICGIVVELCPEDNTFILETGSEASGKSYIKFDKKAVYQTDAAPDGGVEAPAKEAPVEETPVEETPVEEPFEEVAETPVEGEEATKEE